jgi:hypothetical protein
MRSTDIIPPIETKNIWYAISRLIWDSDLVAGRLILATAEFIWSFMLFLPGDTLAHGTDGRSHMIWLLPENGWGLVFLISGLIQFLIVLYENYNTFFAKAFAMFNAFLWMYLVFSIIVDAYPPVAGVAGEIALMFGAVWIWIRPYLLAEGLYRAGIR